MNFSVQHRTSYVYEGQVSESINEAWLCPRSDKTQLCQRFELNINPAGANVLCRSDFFGNPVHHFELLAPHSHLDVIACSAVTTFSDTRDFSVHSDPAELASLKLVTTFYDFLSPSQRVQLPPMILHEAREIVGEITDVQVAVLRLMSFVYENFEYRSGVTRAETGVTDVFSLRSGVCQDFAHVMIALCRVLGVPARYVSGYFFSEKAESSTEVDNTQSHAWVDCYLPGIGWAGYDPTHNRRVGDHYIRAAIGRDYADVRPISGTFRGKAKATMEVAVDISLEEQATIKKLQSSY